MSHDTELAENLHFLGIFDLNDLIQKVNSFGRWYSELTPEELMHELYSSLGISCGTVYIKEHMICIKLQASTEEMQQFAKVVFPQAHHIVSLIQLDDNCWYTDVEVGLINDIPAEEAVAVPQNDEEANAVPQNDDDEDEVNVFIDDFAEHEFDVDEGIDGDVYPVPEDIVYNPFEEVQIIDEGIDEDMFE